MADMCNYASVLAGTRYAFSHQKLSLLADHLKDIFPVLDCFVGGVSDGA
jgi:hypothetical protein